jgi:hypothetical protein
MTDHARAQDLAATAIDFDLTSDEQAELDNHLVGCASCKAHADALRLDARSLAQLRQVDAPARVRSRVVRSPRPAWGMPLALAAAVGVLALAVGVILSSGLNRARQDVATNATPGSSTASFPAGSGAAPSSASSAAPPTPGPRLPTTAWVAVDDRLAFDPKAATPKKDTSSPPPLNCTDCGDTTVIARRSVVRAAVEAAGKIVAVGHGCFGGSYVTCQADVWVSGDGRDWDAVPYDPTLDAGADNDVNRPGGMMDVAAGQGRIVAVGAVAQARRSVATAWVSTDGRDWRPLSLDHEGAGQVFAVTAGPSMLVAVGRVRTDDGVTAAVWVSPDGTSWEPADVNRAAVGHFEGDQEYVAGMFDVTWAQNQFVAVGAECPSLDACRTASWTSRDGRSWDRAGAGTGGRMRSIAYLGSRFVAVGDDGSRQPDSSGGRAWFSLDASAWTAAPIKASGDDGRNPLQAVVAVGTGAIAAGERYALQSSDGRSWTRAKDRAVANGSVFGLAAWRDGVIATGSTYGADTTEIYESPPAIWYLPYR